MSEFILNFTTGYVSFLTIVGKTLVRNTVITYYNGHNSRLIPFFFSGGSLWVLGKTKGKRSTIPDRRVQEETTHGRDWTEEEGIRRERGSYLFLWQPRKAWDAASW